MQTFTTSDQPTGEFKTMLVRLMTRQLYAETATAEIFGSAVSAAPTWHDKFLAAQFTAEEARHSQGLCDLLTDLGEDPDAIIAGRPDAGEFWGITTAAEDLHAVREGLEGQECEVESAKLVMVPNTEVNVSGETLTSLMKLMDMLDDNDDVQNVWNNADFDESELA